MQWPDASGNARRSSSTQRLCSPRPSPMPSPRSSQIFHVPLPILETLVEASAFAAAAAASDAAPKSRPYSRPPSPTGAGHSSHAPEHADEFSQQGHENPTSPGFLSWRKLQLSRAKLKAINKTSALMSGFAMVAMVELQFNDNTKISQGLMISFAVCTSLLVAVHMIALMISTCILPNIEAVSNLHSIQVVDESPHEKMHWYIEASWAITTVLGTFLFLLELALLCWVKFYDISEVAAWAATIVIFPVLVLFVVFAIQFYHKLVAHKYELSELGIRELEQLRNQLDSGDGRTNGATGRIQDV